jgi:tRNA(His) 5'-end guanylyltransferase
MKRYELSSKNFLSPRTPVIARIDGRAFHTFTKKCTRPYDANFHACMWAAAKAVCADVAGCKLAYVQSDEISLLITDYENINTSPHFDYEISKLCSTMAATTATAFLVAFIRMFPEQGAKLLSTEKGLPTFDARAYNVPREDVANYFIWRQKDAERNALSMYAQSLFSHKELHKVSSVQKQELLKEKGILWDEVPTCQKRGVCLKKENSVANRSHWAVDLEIPVFTTPAGRSYIEQFVFPNPVIKAPPKETHKQVLTTVDRDDRPISPTCVICGNMASLCKGVQ